MMSSPLEARTGVKRPPARTDSLPSTTAVHLLRERARRLGESSLAQFESETFGTFGAPAGGVTRCACRDPSTGAILWSVPDLGSETIDRMVISARMAQPGWQALPASEKSALLLRCATALEARSEDIAEVLALESGKSLRTECRAEVALMLSVFRYFAGLAHEIKGKTIQAGESLLGYTTHHPWGVVAGIVPWNVPLMFLSYKAAAPLVAGNTVIVKMPEQGSASTALCLSIMNSILPPGVVQGVTGSGSGAGATLVAHEGVDKISFTGSVGAGRQVLESTAKTLRPTTLELGGKSPMVILGDCDEDKAIDGIIGSMRFTRAGQSCTAASRIYVPHTQLSRYREALGARLNGLKTGDALDEASDCGPVVTALQQSRIEAYIARARTDGLDVSSYGARTVPETQNGWYVDPHLIFSPDIAHPVSQEEIFGPVATITGYGSIDEVTRLSNATPFGLSASVWGKDISLCMQLARDFRVGIVQINQNAIMLPGFSYGGVGVSGQGKESSLEAMIGTYMFEKTNIVNFA